jgi:hypothetical protein
LKKGKKKRSTTIVVVDERVVQVEAGVCRPFFQIQISNFGNF